MTCASGALDGGVPRRHSIHIASARWRRINARLPPDVARKLAYLERRTNRSTTQVLLESIEGYYAAMTEPAGSAAELLARAGFIGCASGPVDLSCVHKPARSVSKTS